MNLPFLNTAQSQPDKTAGIITTSRGLALAIADHSADTPRLDHAQFYPCEITDQQSLLTSLAKEHQLDTIDCCFVLNPDESQFFQVEKPEVDDAELLQALRWHIKDLIDFDIDEVVLDYINLPSSTNHIQVVATRKSIIQGRVDLLRDSNCKIASIDIASHAGRNLIATAKNITSDASVGFLNLWENHAKISLLKDGFLYISRNTSIGTDSLSYVVADNTDSHAVIDSLAIELQRTFDYYESYSRQAPVSKLAIITNTRAVELVDQLIEQRLGIECEVISTEDFANMNIELTMNSADMTDSCLMAVGGALRTEH